MVTAGVLVDAESEAVGIAIGESADLDTTPVVHPHIRPVRSRIAAKFPDCHLES